MARQGKKIPEAIWKKFLELLSEHTTSVSSTCRALNIEARSYYNKRSQDKDFADAVDEIFDRIRRPFAEDALFTLIADRNLGAVKFYLSQRGGKRWNESKIMPMYVRHEIDNPPPSKEFVQRLPSVRDQICINAYKLAKTLDVDNLPDSITIDLTKIKERLKDPIYNRRLKEEAKMYDKNEDEDDD